MKNYLALIGPDGRIWPCEDENESHNDIALRIYDKSEELKKKINSFLKDPKHFAYMDWALMSCGFLHVVIQYEESNGETTVFLNKFEEALNELMRKAINKIISKNEDSVNFVNRIIMKNNKKSKIKWIGAVCESDIKDVINLQGLVRKMMDSNSEFKDFEVDFMKEVCKYMGGEIIDNSKVLNDKDEGQIYN